jgi:hypothetical protein
MRKWEFPEVGMRNVLNSEVGMRKWEKFEFERLKADERRWEVGKMRRWEGLEVGSRNAEGGRRKAKKRSWEVKKIRK